MAKIKLNGKIYEGKEIIIKNGEIIIDGKNKGIIYGNVSATIIEGKESFPDNETVIIK